MCYTIFTLGRKAFDIETRNFRPMFPCCPWCVDFTSVEGVRFTVSFYNERGGASFGNQRKCLGLCLGASLTCMPA